MSGGVGDGWKWLEGVRERRRKIFMDKETKYCVSFFFFAIKGRVEIGWELDGKNDQEVWFFLNVKSITIYYAYGKGKIEGNTLIILERWRRACKSPSLSGWAGMGLLGMWRDRTWPTAWTGDPQEWGRNPRTEVSVEKVQRMFWEEQVKFLCDSFFFPPSSIKYEVRSLAKNENKEGC